MATLKEKLKRGETVYGTWCMLPSSFTIDAIGMTGLDFIIIDMEHGPMSFQTAEEMVRAVQVHGCHPVIRVDDDHGKTILHALEVGAEAVLVPHVSTSEIAEKVASATKYYPEGNRGLSPYTRNHGYSHVGLSESLQKSNHKIVTGILVEGKTGLDNLESILNVPGIDVVYLGVYDICQSLGIPGQLDHPDLIRSLKDSVKKINSRGMAAGSFARDETTVKMFKEAGIQFIAYMCDAAGLIEYYANAIKMLRSC